MIVCLSGRGKERDGRCCTYLDEEIGHSAGARTARNEDCASGDGAGSRASETTPDGFP